MQLEGEFATRSNVDTGVLRKYVGLVARCIANQVVVEYAGITLGLRRGGVDRACENVVDHFAIAWNYCGGLNPNSLV